MVSGGCPIYFSFPVLGAPQFDRRGGGGGGKSQQAKYPPPTRPFDPLGGLYHPPPDHLTPWEV
eukprot:468747-Prorocentrum_minimum.AAC.1